MVRCMRLLRCAGEAVLLGPNAIYLYGGGTVRLWKSNEADTRPRLLVTYMSFFVHCESRLRHRERSLSRALNGGDSRAGYDSGRHMSYEPGSRRERRSAECGQLGIVILCAERLGGVSYLPLVSVFFVLLRDACSGPGDSEPSVEATYRR